MTIIVFLMKIENLNLQTSLRTRKFVQIKSKQKLKSLLENYKVCHFIFRFQKLKTSIWVVLTISFFLKTNLVSFLKIGGASFFKRCPSLIIYTGH